MPELDIYVAITWQFDKQFRDSQWTGCCLIMYCLEEFSTHGVNSCVQERPLPKIFQYKLMNIPIPMVLVYIPMHIYKSCYLACIHKYDCFATIQSVFTIACCLKTYVYILLIQVYTTELAKKFTIKIAF